MKNILILSIFSTIIAIFLAVMININSKLSEPVELKGWDTPNPGKWRIYELNGEQYGQ